MTTPTLAQARRLMTLRVPRGDIFRINVPSMEPVSLSLIEFGGEGLVFRLVDAQGRLLDLVLNPVVAGAFHDCIALPLLLAGEQETPRALEAGEAG